MGGAGVYLEGLIHRGAYFPNFKVTVCPKCNKLLQVRVIILGPKCFSVISDVSNTPLKAAVLHGCLLHYDKVANYRIYSNKRPPLSIKRRSQISAAPE